MKKLFTLLAFTACLATANWSCSDDYDDSELRREIENLKQELAQIKSQISSLQTIINAVDTDKFITKITKTDNGTPLHSVVAIPSRSKTVRKVRTLRLSASTFRRRLLLDDRW